MTITLSFRWVVWLPPTRGETSGSKGTVGRNSEAPGWLKRTYVFRVVRRSSRPKRPTLEGSSTMSYRTLPPAPNVRRRRGRLATTLALGALTLAPRPAAARPIFTDWLRGYIDSRDDSQTRVPQSIVDRPLCHEGSDTTAGFLDRPFTNALRQESNYVTLTAQSKTIFLAAIAAIDEKGLDSDCDGFPDLDEIIANFSPNIASSHPSGEPPQAPCGEQPPAPAPTPAPEPDDGDDDDDNGARPPPAPPAASSCAVSSTGRPLDASALFLTALVALPLTRRALRPRKRRPNAGEP
ncbi:MAG TPA: hypothetical protein VFS43_35475 [Polyangiaceae bacterium]|nr:hypothetical protein [Polyangiaceae bacterium]